MSALMSNFFAARILSTKAMMGCWWVGVADGIGIFRNCSGFIFTSIK